MSFPGKNMARLKEWCKDGPQTFTDWGLDQFIQVPRLRDPLKEALMLGSGCRPSETQEEVINFHCEILGLEYWKTFSHKTLETMHHFKIKGTHQFSRATPSGQLTMTISNPNAIGFLEKGESNYLYFTKALNKY